ncbi:MAG: PH domain-containing protein [Actinobacteria bacterium]|nr:PH domain-containing protein [Actinomycetota bacterium]
MPYPRRLLNEGEEVTYDLRPHWWFFAKEAGLGTLVVVLLVLVTRLDDDSTARDLGFWAFAVVAVVWALWVLWRLAVWLTTHFVVTSDRLIFRQGVLSRHGREIPLERVNDISFNQSFWERIIGAGDLLIESAGEQGQQRFTDIPQPESVQQEIYRQIEANQARTMGGGREPTVPEQIEKLADLRDRGVLTPEEFEAKKQQLLDRL